MSTSWSILEAVVTEAGCSETFRCSISARFSKSKTSRSASVPSVTTIKTLQADNRNMVSYNAYWKLGVTPITIILPQDLFTWTSHHRSGGIPSNDPERSASSIIDVDSRGYFWTLSVRTAIDNLPKIKCYLCVQQDDPFRRYWQVNSNCGARLLIAMQCQASPRLQIVI